MARLIIETDYALLIELRRDILAYASTDAIRDVVTTRFEAIFNISSSVSLHLLLYPTLAFFSTLRVSIRDQLLYAEDAIIALMNAVNESQDTLDNLHFLINLTHDSRDLNSNFDTHRRLVFNIEDAQGDLLHIQDHLNTLLELINFSHDILKTFFTIHHQVQQHRVIEDILNHSDDE